ncbi:MAG: sensor histidine kinase [Lachnospiraceae bacterium]
MIERLYLLFEVLALVTGLFALHEKKKRPTIATIIYIAIQLIIESSIEIGWLPQQTEQILYLGLIVLCLYEFDDKLYNACLYTVLDITLLGIVQILFAMIVCLFLGTLYVDTLAFMIVNIATLIIAIILYRYCNLSKHIQFIFKNGIIGRGILIIAVFLCMYSFGIFKSRDKIYWKTAVEMTFFVLVFAFIVYEWQKEKWMNRQREEEIKTFEQYNLIYKDLIQEVRRRQHDFNNHLQAIFSMNALADNLEDLVEEQNEYCAKLIAENTTNKLLREDIPSVLAGFLYTKIGQAEKEGITVKYRIIVDEVEKHIRFSDLVEIIGNLFDNSMEAVVHEEQKLIECYVEQSENELMIEISNPCAFKTTKADNMTEDGKSTKGENRGLGLGNVKRKVEKYHGTLEIKSTDKMGVNFIIFRARMPLDI